MPSNLPSEGLGGETYAGGAPVAPPTGGVDIPIIDGLPGGMFAGGDFAGGPPIVPPIVYGGGNLMMMGCG